MRFHIIAVSQKVPNWVAEAYQDYHKRFPREFLCNLTEIPLQKRGKTTSIDRVVREEGQKIQAAKSKGGKTIALEVKGIAWSTEQLAQNIEQFQSTTPVINFLIGGPDGLSDDCLKAADYRWSLSPLTLPHTLVRIILIEQLYRAISIIQGHPYHRA